jgi:hypothetical protein
MEHPMTYIERLEQDIAEIQGECADLADYMPWDGDTMSDVDSE